MIEVTITNGEKIYSEDVTEEILEYYAEISSNGANPNLPSFDIFCRNITTTIDDIRKFNTNDENAHFIYWWIEGNVETMKEFLANGNSQNTRIIVENTNDGKDKIEITHDGSPEAIEFVNELKQKIKENEYFDNLEDFKKSEDDHSLLFSKKIRIFNAKRKLYLSLLDLHPEELSPYDIKYLDILVKDREIQDYLEDARKATKNIPKI